MNETTGDRIVATYELHDTERSPEALAAAIALEQTVEVPQALADATGLPPGVVGEIERIEIGAGAGGATPAVLSYDPAVVEAGGMPALVNLVFGNVSMMSGVRLVDLAIPERVLAGFDGPRHGVAGVRALTGVYGRPLLATALKPRGLDVSEYARMAGAFARAGGDLVKDDQNLVADFEGFRDRAIRCRDEVAEANARTGRSCLYFPLVTAPAESIERHLDLVRDLGLEGVLLCPAVLGLDGARALAARHGLVFMAHPSLAGGLTRGVGHGLFFGTLLRLAGVDISVFPDVRGRFSFGRETCSAIRHRLRAPLGALRPVWPCPAGGLRYDGIEGACAEYGEDSVLLVGGALLGHAPRLEDGVRAFAERIAACFPEHRHDPGVPPETPESVEILPFRPGFAWEGRESSAYKTADPGAAIPPFRGVRRVELVGRRGERTRSDLRYFEVEPGGHTSHERHAHAHIIIGARGEGRLVTGDRAVAIRPRDVAFLPPFEPHQLRNESSEPFGFFCVVDHERDRPMPI